MIAHKVPTRSRRPETARHFNIGHVLSEVAPSFTIRVINTVKENHVCRPVGPVIASSGTKDLLPSYTRQVVVFVSPGPIFSLFRYVSTSGAFFSG
jgi:hypothetical protein